MQSPRAATPPPSSTAAPWPATPNADDHGGKNADRWQRMVDLGRPYARRATAWLVARPWAPFLILGIGYAFGFTGRWHPGPDSSIHLQIARNLARGDGFRHPNGVEETVNPGLAYLVAATHRLGDASLMSSHVAMLLIGVATAAMIYWLFALHFGRTVAVLLTLLTVVTETFYRYCFLLLTDMPFLLGVVTALVGLERLTQRRPRAWLSVAMIAAAIVWMAAFRSVVAVFIVGVAGGLVWQAMRARHRVIAGAGLGLLAVAVLATRLFDARGSLSSLTADERIIRMLLSRPWETLHDAVLVNLPALLSEAVPEAVFGVDMHPVLAAPLGLMVLAAAVSLGRARPIWAGVVLAFVLQWCLFVVAGRYLLAVLPLLVAGWWQLCVAVADRLPRPWGRRAAIAMVWMLAIPNFVLCANFVAEQHGYFGYADKQRERERVLRELAGGIRTLPPDAVVIAGGDVTGELAYYADRTVWSSVRAPRKQRPDGPVYVVQPTDAVLDAWLGERRLVPGEPVISVPSRKATWYLRPAERPVRRKPATQP